MQISPRYGNKELPTIPYLVRLYILNSKFIIDIFLLESKTHVALYKCDICYISSIKI